jgi:hypothetical protein
MCTQEIIWCKCGHGEFLPVTKCSIGKQFDDCWLVLHGDHRIVVEMDCSYCKAGLDKILHLRSPRPRADLANQIETSTNTTMALARQESGLEEGSMSGSGEIGNSSVTDVLDTDFGAGFNLAEEFWQYQ